MASEKTVNYTAEQTSQMIEMFQSGTAVEAIASTMGRTVRSVIAKLSREGVYKAKSKTAAGKRVTKAELVNKIADAVGVEGAKLATLEKASHEALEILAREFE